MRIKRNSQIGPEHFKKNQIRVLLLAYYTCIISFHLYPTCSVFRKRDHFTWEKRIQFNSIGKEEEYVTNSRKR